MEQATDRYEELGKYLGIDKAKEEYNKLSKKEQKNYNKIKSMVDVFDEMKDNAVNFEFLKEMLVCDKIALFDDFSLPYEEYIQKPRTNCLMTKDEYNRMKGILYGRNSID